MVVLRRRDHEVTIIERGVGKDATQGGRRRLGVVVGGAETAEDRSEAAGKKKEHIVDIVASLAGIFAPPRLTVMTIICSRIFSV